MKKQLTLTAVALGITVAAIPQVHGHGYMDSPKARQTICQEQGGFWWPKDGSNIPNAACRAAFVKSDHVQFIQRHEFAANVADFNNQTAVESAVPNGKLCAAGDANKAGMNIASADWQRTVVKPNSNGDIKVRYRATTPHNPSFWQFYLTKPGTPISTESLRWDQLELVQEHGNVAFFMAPDGKRYYEMTVAIPEKFDGDAILYSRWQRDDVVGEGFYNCSDITIERTDSTPDPVVWHSAGFYLKQGQDALAGDTVWLRLFDANGQELIQQQFKVTEQSLDWAMQLAQQVVQDNPDLLQIGIKSASGDVTFDHQNLSSNQVFVSNKAHSYNLSVVKKPVNTAPTVHTPKPLTVEENTSKHLHVHAFDDEQSTLTFDWQLPNALSYTGAGSTISVSAPDVAADTEYTGQVTVSDGLLSKTVPLHITVTNKVTPPTPPTPPEGDTWQANKVYTAGDTAVYNGKTYRAKWWVKGQRPDQSQAWQLVTTDDSSNAWNTSTAYQGGSIVTFQNHKYKARWWTRGQQPGSNAVWQKL
ncbi:lytic polysaccharide monooxygenase [Pseudoalteromonas sp. MMG005]|uniref:lytic polysaccharide monooxygenase n=1 Tax=Pseudoalteromonas sp. MMG005 TaxID=2822682 RepID=UPI001B3A3983|nr:lytic polysaccharide monooxygenase [Pseudoalteromonas sp. MMG005]MBQ4844695.1 lytic polysaccharide monooxygenase [Pseudoalteromonas sp. MMG005]